MTLNQITKVKGPGIHTLANIVSNTISLGGIATASNFKTGTSNLHNVGLEIAGINVLGADTPIGTGATIYDAGGAVFTGVVTATKFIGQADISGGSIVGTSATFTGNVSIGGTLTYEDVTNIDSVGLITARNGLHITGGKVGIGFTNPTEKFEVKDGSIGLIGGSYKIDTHPLVSYSSFVLGGGNYAARLGSTGTTTIRHTQIYAGGVHRATFDGVNNRLGIGITNPATKTQIHGGDGTLLITGNTAVGSAANTGGTIALGGIYHNDGSITGWAQIKGFKDNNTSNNYNGYLSFTTRDTTDGYVERLRIKSDGTIIPGTNNATSIGDGTTNFNTFWASTRFRGNDNVKLILGSAQDFVIRHDGSNNIIGSPVGGDLHIKSGTGDNDNQLIAAFKHSNGSVGIGTDNPDTKLEVWSTGNNNSVLKLSPGTTAGNYGGIELGRTDGGGNVRMTTVVKGGVPISGISGIEFGSSNTNLPAVSLASANTAGGHIAFKPKGSEKMRIASDGKILMGVAASNGPATPLHIYGGSDTTPILAFTRSTVHDDWQGAGIGLDDEGGTYKGALTFYTHESSGTKNDSVTEKMRITSSGKVGINQSDPYYNLQINFDNATSTLSDGSGGNWGGAGLRLENDNTTAGSMSLIHFRTYDADWHFGSKYVSANNSDLVFLHEGTDEALRIRSGGLLLTPQDYPNFRPMVDWNFTAVKKLDPRLTYKRTGPASYVDHYGIVKLVAYNVPRFDHDPVTGECKGLLIEPSRTNQMINSSDITGDTAQNGTITGDATTAPDGTTTADKYAANSTNGLHRVDMPFTSGQIANSTAYTFSVFVKANGYDKLHIRYAGYGADDHGRGYDLSDGSTFDGKYDGTSGLAGVTSSSIYPYPNGWYRCSFTVTTASNATSGVCQIFYYISNSESTTNFAGDGSSGMYFWGAQMEVGGYVTSHIPTDGETRTRGSDFAYLDGTTGTEFDDIYRTDEGTFVLDWFNDPNGNHNDGYVFTIDDGTGNNRIGAVNSNNYQLTVSNSGSSQGNRDLGSINSGANKMAFTYKLDDQATSLNGSDASVDTSCTIPTTVLKYWWIGLRQGQYDQLGGYVRRIIYYPKRLPNGQLKTLTS